MRARIQKWGNSLAVRIPKVFASEAGLHQDELVELSLVEGNLLIKPVVRVKPTLAELIAGITDENRHSEIDFGPPVGQEEW
jgi:antitoxin MazE